MSVYVDALYVSRSTTTGHMIADSTAELLSMAEALGLDRSALVGVGTWREHYGLSLPEVLRAVDAGAIEISTREFAERISARRPLT